MYTVITTDMTRITSAAMKAGAVTAVMAVTEVMSRPSDLGQLFKTFIKIGVFTFGGGYAMISVIENLCVEQKQWITHEDTVRRALKEPWRLRQGW